MIDTPAAGPVAIDQTGPGNPAGLSDPEVKQLVGGGPIGGAKWLYPYNGTVFPRGTVAPLVMWHSEGAPDAVYLQIRSKTFSYKGVLKPSVDGALFTPSGGSVAAVLGVGANLVGAESGSQIAIPQEVWALAGRQSQGKSDPTTIEITERVGGQVHGPLTAQIKIAQASFKGSVYYNACVSGTAGGLGSGLGGRIMRVPSGGNAELVSSDAQCVGCHSVSADGSRLVAQRSNSAQDVLTTFNMNVIQGLNYQIDAAGKLQPITGKTIGPIGSYGALYPNGAAYLTTTGKLPVGYMHGFVIAPDAAQLIDLATNAVIPGTGIPETAAMPNFSPDGRLLVFNDFAVDNAHALAVMDYDTTAHKATNYRELARDPASSPMRPGWPFFLPDNKAVVFVRTSSQYFTALEGGGLSASANANLTGMATKAMFPSDLYIADLATGKVTLLARAMGFDTPADADADKTYLPFGVEDLHQNYFPTVSPVAAGGYFWVFFDSLRHFGSLGITRVLWGFALDIQPDGNYALDTSNPPFYLPGQEWVGSTHHRAFAALDRCKPEGQSCKTGIDCCGGTCSLPAETDIEFLEAVGTCGPPPPRDTCAKRDERCTSAANCCDSSHACINGFCAVVELL